MNSRDKTQRPTSSSRTKPTATASSLAANKTRSGCRNNNSSNNVPPANSKQTRRTKDTNNKFSKPKLLATRKQNNNSHTTDEESGESEALLLITSNETPLPTASTANGNGGEQIKLAMSDNLEQETDVDEDRSGKFLLSRDDSSSGNEASESLLTLTQDLGPNLTGNIETPLRAPRAVSSGESLLPGWEEHRDKDGLYYWHVASGVLQRTKPTREDQMQVSRKNSLNFYLDDEEINQTTNQRTSSDDDEFLESGAALTIDDTVNDSTFVVYPMGCCEVDETQLMSANCTKTIQKCILQLANSAPSDEMLCWGLDQSEPVLMKLLDDHIQFTHIKSNSLLRSQPIQTIKSWAVDDDNNFAFVVEDRATQQQQLGQGATDDAFDCALLSQPNLSCYVFSSMDDDDMSCKVAAKLNQEITRYKEQMSDRVYKSMRVQQMVEPAPAGDQTDLDGDELEDLEASNEMTMNVKYIGNTLVLRPVGIDVLNIAIDKCLSEASQQQLSRATSSGSDGASSFPPSSPLTDALLHVSPSSVIVENETTGDIIVECRIRYLTFMGISRRDIRWCGFIMQDTTNKSFVAHCFECHPTAGHVCEAIQVSCAKMYEKVVKNSQARRMEQTTSIIPSTSKIRNTLAKTFSRIKLNPIIR